MRRRPGTGSYFRSRTEGRWIAQVSWGARGSQHKVRRIARSEREAKAALLKLLERYGEATTTTSLGSYLRSWLAGRVDMKASTAETYEIAIRRHLEPRLGTVALGRLTSEAVARAGLGRNELGVLSSALGEAVRRGLVERNVARFVRAPRHAPVDRRALSPEEARRILAAVAGDRLEALYVLALACGLRQAELLALSWDDWDREAATIRVAYALDRQDGHYVRVEPKTRRSRRTVALPAFAQEALIRHRAAQVAERIAAGQPTSAGFIFVTPAGLPVNQGTLTHRWRALSRAAGLDLRFHDLRHAQASLLVAQGIHPRVVAERLGHATVAMAMDRYAHVGSASDREAASAIDAAVGTR